LPDPPELLELLDDERPDEELLLEERAGVLRLRDEEVRLVAERCRELELFREPELFGRDVDFGLVIDLFLDDERLDFFVSEERLFFVVEDLERSIDLPSSLDGDLFLVDEDLFLVVDLFTVRPRSSLFRLVVDLSRSTRLTGVRAFLSSRDLVASRVLLIVRSGPYTTFLRTSLLVTPVLLRSFRSTPTFRLDTRFESRERSILLVMVSALLLTRRLSARTRLRLILFTARA